MKFGRYLAENATPEWKRAYIDYRAAKKAIKRVTERLTKVPDPPTTGGPINALSRIATRTKGDHGKGDGNASDSSEDGDHGPASTKIRRTFTLGQGSVRSVGSGGGGGSAPAPASGGVSGGTSNVPSPRPIAAGISTGTGTVLGSSWRNSPSSLTPASALGRGRSPSYGAMGTSPRLTEGRVHPPPPLDLGEPHLDEAAEENEQEVIEGEWPGPSSGPGAGTGSAPPADSTVTSSTVVSPLSSSPVSPMGSSSKRHSSLRDPNRTRTRGANVNFSPRITSIPDADDGNEADRDEASDHASRGHIGGVQPWPTQAPHTPSDASMTQSPPKDGERTPHAETTDNRLPGPGSTPKKSPKRSPSMFRFSLVSPRVQPSAGLTQGGVADAPSGTRSIHSLKLPSPRLQPRTARSFDELYESLQPDEQAFFDLLDHELLKVETFYQQRENEAVKRGQELRDQLRDLAEHRRVFHETFPAGVPEWEVAVGHLLGAGTTSTAAAVPRPIQRLTRRRPNTSGVTSDEASSRAATPPGNRNGYVNGKTYGTGNGTPNGKHVANKSDEDEYREMARQYDPERYQKYKKELRSAMLDYYRHLELIKNYRILNLTGFRKALKKFEKATKIICLELYTEDRISPCSFSRGETIDNLIKQTESLFTEHFEHGDGKKARDKLRGQDQSNSHYFSVFRSGIMLGLGVPPAILAIVKTFDPETRQAIPGYAALEQIYVGLYIPVIFAMLFEVNLMAYVAARINYEFVMELDRPTLDFRSYFEIPAFFFMTLSYCFFFSFYRVATHSVAPTTWPLAWLVFVCVFFLNPLPIFRRRSRYWFLRVLFRVITPGYSRVEFIAFFIADELNSLSFSIQNLMFIGCTYSHHWPGAVYDTCASGRSWPYALLATVPPLIRLIQCLKRWYDSNLQIHLINAGKYASSIIQAVLFVYWRSTGSPQNTGGFVTWVIFATIASIYTCSWDFVVDWSLLRPHHHLLRPDLGYSQTWVYYFAMVTNFFVRFIWVWYLPNITAHTHMRSWIFAMCEMLRRWQWNFFRVETEHLGNADAYRVTREVVLPYRRDEDDDLDEYAKGKPTSGGLSTLRPAVTETWRRIRVRLVGHTTTGRVPGTLNVGPMGHAPQREYEARRIGDWATRNSDDSSTAV